MGSIRPNTMFATPISSGRRFRGPLARRRCHLLLLMGLVAGPVWGADLVGTNLLAQFRQAYSASHLRLQHDTNNVEAAWQFARACFDLAQAATNDTERARIADEGI